MKKNRERHTDWQRETYRQRERHTYIHTEKQEEGKRVKLKRSRWKKDETDDGGDESVSMATVRLHLNSFALVSVATRRLMI